MAHRRPEIPELPLPPGGAAGSAEYPVMGIRVRIESDLPAAIRAAEAAFGVWRSLPPQEIRPAPALRIRVEASEEAEPPRRRGSWRHDVAGDCLTARGPGFTFTADRQRGEARVRVEPALPQDSLRFRHEVLECLALWLVTGHDRTPLHAAGVAWGDRGVLLAGASGAGKSSLAYACLRLGFRLLAEDAVYVQMDGGPRAWGRPGPVRLPLRAAALFPELAGLPPLPLPGGKSKLVVDPAAQDSQPPCLYMESPLVCLLEPRRDRRIPVLAAADPGEASARLQAELADGFDKTPPAPALLAALTREGAWRLNLGRDPAAAAQLLRRLFDDVATKGNLR